LVASVKRFVGDETAAFTGKFVLFEWGICVVIDAV
jgi:hypothetical protein